MERKKKSWILLISLLLSLFSITTVNAQEQFSVQGDAVVRLFECNPTTSQITVTNTGSVPNSYLLTLPEDADWITLGEDQFNLNAGESKIVTVGYFTPCDAKNTELVVSIATGYGEEGEVVQQLLVEKPLNIDIKGPTNIEITPCETATYDLTIKNPYNFTEDYTLKIEKLEDASLSTGRLILDPQAEEKVLLTATPKDCTKYGVFQFDLFIDTEKTELSLAYPFTLEILPTNIPEIAKGISKIRVGEGEGAAELTISNLGDKPTEYLLSVSGPNWVTVEPEELAVSPRGKSRFLVVTNPPKDTKPGDYQITVKATVKSTDLAYTKPFTVQLKAKPLVQKLFTEYRNSVLGGVIGVVVLIIVISLVVQKVTSPEYKRKSALRKKEAQKRKAELEKKKAEEKAKEEAQKKHEEERVRKERETAEKEAKKTTEKELKEKFLFVDRQQIVQGEKVKSPWLYIVLLVVLLAVAAYFAVVKWELLKQNLAAVGVGIGALVVLIVIGAVRRRHRRKKKWKLVLAHEKKTLNTNWKKGITEVEISLSNAARKLVLIVKKGKRKTPVAPTEPTYQYFTVKQNVPIETVEELNCKFKVPLKWLKKKEIPVSNVKLASYTEGQWQTTKAELLSKDEKYAFYTAETNTAEQYAITGTPAPKEKKKSKGWLIGVLVVLGVLLVAGGIYTALEYQKPPLVIRGVPPQTWAQDTTHKVNLADFIKDPDGDPLTFTSSKVDKIDVFIKENIAHLSPEKGFYGERYIVFTASDGKGGIVQTSPVKLTVKKSLLPPVLRENMVAVLAVLVVLIIVLLIIVLVKGREKK